MVTYFYFSDRIKPIVKDYKLVSNLMATVIYKNNKYLIQTIEITDGLDSHKQNIYCVKIEPILFANPDKMDGNFL